MLLLHNDIFLYRYVPSRNILGGVTSLRFFVVYFSYLTAEISRLLVVETHVKPLAIGGVGIFGVNDNLAIGVRLVRFGTLETVLEFF